MLDAVKSMIKNQNCQIKQKNKDCVPLISSFVHSKFLVNFVMFVDKEKKLPHAVVFMSALLARFLFNVAGRNGLMNRVLSSGDQGCELKLHP